MALDSFFDGIGSVLLLFLLLAVMAKGENDAMGKKAEDTLAADITEPSPQRETSRCIHKSRNRKKLKPKAKYF